MAEELTQTNIPADKSNFLTESQIRALIVESATNFTDVMRVRKQIKIGDKFGINGSDGTLKIKDDDGNVIILLDANG